MLEGEPLPTKARRSASFEHPSVLLVPWAHARVFVSRCSASMSLSKARHAASELLLSPWFSTG